MLTSIDASVMFDPKRMATVMREWERSLLPSLDSVHVAMRQLSSTSKQIEGKRFYIELYDLRVRTGGVRLRWRAVDVNGHKNSLWTAVAQGLDTMPAMMSDWYRKSNIDMEWLNTVELVLRGVLREAKRTRNYKDT
jgi:hypothetical protein